MGCTGTPDDNVNSYDASYKALSFFLQGAQSIIYNHEYVDVRIYRLFLPGIGPEENHPFQVLAIYLLHVLDKPF